METPALANSKTAQDVKINRRRLGRPIKVVPKYKETKRRNLPVFCYHRIRYRIDHGSGVTGQQGLGPDTFDRLYPRVVKMMNGDILTNVIAMLAGGMHGICLTERG